MSEKEKDILKQISTTLPKLARDKQEYILGFAEGMAAASASKNEKTSKEDCEE